MDEPSVEGHVPGEDSETLMVLPDDEGMPTPRAAEQVTEVDALPTGDTPPDSD